MHYPSRFPLLAATVAAAGLMSGCASALHAVVSPLLDAGISSAVEMNATPESMGVSTAHYRGQDCASLKTQADSLHLEKQKPQHDTLTVKALGWHVDAINQVQQEQGCASSTVVPARNAATPPPASTTTFYFYCYATDANRNIRKTVASTVFEQPIAAMDPAARFNYTQAAEEEFKRKVMPSHGVPGAQPTCVAEDTLAKANSSRARYRDLFSGFNLTFVDLTWRPTVQAAPSAAATTGPAVPKSAGVTPGTGYLGIGLSAVDATMAKALGLAVPRGALVVERDPAVPFVENGLKPLDVVLEIAGQAVMQPSDLQSTVQRMRPGYKAPLRIWRDRAEKELVVVIGVKPPVSPPVSPAASPVAAAPLGALPVSTATTGAPRYCHAALVPVGKPGGVQSLVWEERGADVSQAVMLRSMAGFVAHVRQIQPGIWHDDIPTGKCFGGSNHHCSASALRHFGTSQQINQFCHVTREQAEQARQRLAANQNFTTIEWAPPSAP